MSLGGLTAIALAERRPDLVRRLVLVDITPGVDRDKAKAITDFVRGPATFASFDEILARTIEHNPTRSEASLRRGILHNAEQLEDGSWRWRYRRHDDVFASDADIDTSARLWDALGDVRVPVMLGRVACGHSRSSTTPTRPTAAPAAGGRRRALRRGRTQRAG